MRRYRSVGLRPPLPQRTLDYLAHGADEGRRNAELFDAACQFRDASIAPEEAETQLIARATLDGLSEAEARTAIRSAFTHTPREPVGGNGPLPTPTSIGAPPRREPKPHRDAPPLSPVALPSPIADGFAALVDACFGPAEFVAIAPAREDEAGEVVPTRGVTMTREEWKQRVAEKGGIERCFSTALGLFLRINPMTKGGAKNEDVTAFRHVLVEFDRDDKDTPIPKEQQFAAILASGLPVSALLDSGNKSLHAWVRVDAPDATEYRRRVDIIWDWFEGRCLDRQNKNPSRLSRCPEGRRTVDGEVRTQRLLALGLGVKSWTEWEAAHAPDGLPKIISGTEFMAVQKPEPPQLIAGVLHQGSKMILGGASKSRKSWTLIDMMLAISTGSPWWGFQTQRGRVLYINFELPDFAFQHRLQPTWLPGASYSASPRALPRFLTCSSSIRTAARVTEWAHARTGIDIHPGASIGSHFFIDHGTGVVIGETCRIGSYVKLYHGVTLGARSFAKDEAGHIVKGTKRHPDVEDHVTIYPNSTILGGETVIGEGSTIGANVFLMHSVPPHSLVVYEERQLSILDKKAKRKTEIGEFSI